MAAQVNQHIGFDPGFGHVKAWTARGGLRFPAQVSYKERELVGQAGLVTTVRPPLVNYEGVEYYVGPGAHNFGRPLEDMTLERLAGTPQIMALFFTALAQANISGNVGLTLGLPIEAFRTVHLKEAAVRAFQGQHVYAVNGQTMTLNVEKVAVTSQPVGALLDYLIDTNTGRMSMENRAAFQNGEFGIINIGMNTVDVAVINKGRAAEAKTHGGMYGVRRLLRMCDQKGLYTIAELDARLLANDMTVSAMLPSWAASVLGVIDEAWGSTWERFERIVVSGGGSILMQDYLRTRYGDKLFMPQGDDVLISTARGLYKTYGLTNQ